MAKVSMVQREKKRARTVEKYAKKRTDLKAIIGDIKNPHTDNGVQ